MASKKADAQQKLDVGYDLPAGPETEADHHARLLVQHAAKLALHAAVNKRHDHETPLTWIQAAKRQFHDAGWKNLAEPFAIALGAVELRLLSTPMRHAVAAKLLKQTADESRFRADQVRTIKRTKKYPDTVIQSIAGTKIESMLELVDVLPNSQRDDVGDKQLAAQLQRKPFRIREDGSSNRQIYDDTKLVERNDDIYLAAIFKPLIERPLRRQGETSEDEARWTDHDMRERSPYLSILDPLGRPHSILLAEDQWIPGRWTVVRSTATDTYKVGTQVDGNDQHRLDAYRAAGGRIYYARRGKEFATDAICERHPWGKTPGIVNIYHEGMIRPKRTLLVGDDWFNWVEREVKLHPELLRTPPSELDAMRKSNPNVPHIRAINRWRQICECPVCNLPIANPVLRLNADPITVWRNWRKDARNAYFQAHKRWPDSRTLANLVVDLGDGNARQLGTEPDLVLVGTPYRVPEDGNLGLAWFSLREDMANAWKFPPRHLRTREQWARLNREVGKPPVDGITLEVGKPWKEYESGPATDEEREIENEEVLSEMAVDNLYRA